MVKKQELQEVESFAELFAKQIELDDKIEGKVVKGTVISIDKDMINIDVGYKAEGRINVREFVGKDKRGFYLAPRLSGDSLKLKLTIYHEIGHIIKQSKYHVCYNCDEIMAEYSPKDISVYKDEDFWNKRLNEYFRWLNSNTIIIQEK